MVVITHMNCEVVCTEDDATETSAAGYIDDICNPRQADDLTFETVKTFLHTVCCSNYLCITLIIIIISNLYY